MPITDGRPDDSSTLTPFLCCAPASEAIDFYCRVFGATVSERMDGPDGTVVHAELALPQGRLELGDPNPAYGLVAPDPAAEAVTGSIGVYVPDVDAAFTAAVAGGARVREEPATFVTGDRYCSVVDPYGHRWSIMTRVEDVPREEARRRLDEWMAAQG